MLSGTGRHSRGFFDHSSASKKLQPLRSVLAKMRRTVQEWTIDDSPRKRLIGFSNYPEPISLHHSLA
jgi:hypothetical protein